MQDLGEEYSADELKIIVSGLDPEDTGLVEFAQFIAWWGDEE